MSSDDRDTDNVVAQHIARARQSLAGSNAAGALSELDEALGLRPLDVEAWFLRALALERESKHGEALESCSRAVRYGSSDTRVHALCSGLALKLGDPELAVVHATRALLADEKNARSLLLRGIGRYERGDMRLAIISLDQYTNERSSDRTGWWLSGNARLALGLLDDAEKDFGIVRRHESGDAMGLVGLARVSLARGEFPEALRFASQVSESDAELGDAAFVRGAALYALRRWSEAAREFATLAQDAPEWGARGHLFAAVCNFEKGELRDRPLDPSVDTAAWQHLTAIGRLYAGTIGPDEAVAAAMERATSAAERCQVMFYAAAWLASRGDGVAALKYFDAASLIQTVADERWTAAHVARQLRGR